MVKVRHSCSLESATLGCGKQIGVMGKEPCGELTEPSTLECSCMT